MSSRNRRSDWYREKHPRASLVRDIVFLVLLAVVAVVLVIGAVLVFGKSDERNTKPVSMEGVSLESSSSPESTSETPDINMEEPEESLTENEESGGNVAENSQESVPETPSDVPSSEPEVIVIPPIPERSYAVVVLDPGHGGVDGGCDVTIDGVMYKEKDIDLAVALYVRDYLEQMDNIQVYMTRETDKKVSLDNRPVVGNEKQADLFVSFHCNSFTKNTAKGLECYSHENSAESGKISEKLIACLKNAGLDTKIRGTRTADYKVLRESYYAAVLFEMGFMTNAEDLKNLTDDDYQKKLAKALADAIYSVVKK